jgi:hypothetical protein
MTDLQLADSSPDHFPGALVHWADRLDPSKHSQHIFDVAFKAIDSALLTTAAYLAVRDMHPDKTTELRLSALWMDASRAVAPIDPDFANSMAYKGLGWANPAFWDVARDLRYKIEVTDVQKARALLTRQRQALERKLEQGRTLFAPAHITAGSPVLMAALVLAGIFGFGCIYGGIQLMAAPGSGDTVFNFLGLEFSTKQAGVAAIALGAAAIILIFRRVLKTVVDLGRI